MSNNNNNNNSGLFGNTDEKAIEERKEEMQLLGRFRNVIINKLEKMTTEMEDSEDSNNKVYQMGEHEKKILLQMQGMGLAEGMAAGVATFVFLRRGPSWIARYLLKRRQGGTAMNNTTTTTGVPNNNNNPFHNAASQNTMKSSNNNGGGYQLSNPFPSAGNATQNNPNFPRSRNPFVRAVWFVFDTTLSLMMAANVSLQYTDLTRMRDDLQELPLAEGKSLVSDAFCRDLTQELQAIQTENSPAYQRLVRQYQNKTTSSQEGSSSSDKKGISPLALYMEGVTMFSQNCERRAFRQREIFQEQGGASGFDGGASLSFDEDGENADGTASNISNSNNDDFHSLPIPPPGVAKDGPRLVRISSTEKGGTDGDEYKVVYGDGGNDDGDNNSNDSEYWRGSL